MRSVTQLYGRSLPVVSELARQLGISVDNVRQIEKELLKEEPALVTDRCDPRAPWQGGAAAGCRWLADGPPSRRAGPCVERLNSTFCRRCCLYACKLHGARPPLAS